MASKLEEGNFKSAVWFTCAVDVMADHSLETLEVFKKEHHVTHTAPSPHPPSLFSFSISQSTIGKVTSSFPNVTAAELGGLSTQHLKDLTGPTSGERSLLLLRALTSLVFLNLRGDTQVTICTHFFGSFLIAVRKGDGPVHPIAVGCTLRRLEGECAGLYALSIVLDIQAPLQSGFGVSQGVETTVHAARIYL